MFKVPSQQQQHTNTNSNRGESKVSCPYCPSSVPVIDDMQAGDMVCCGCGLVLGDRVIDVGAEWRSFSNDNAGLNKSRVGAEESALYDGMLS